MDTPTGFQCGRCGEEAVKSWSSSYTLLPVVRLYLEKKEHIAGSRAAGELLTLSKFSPGALDLSLVSWYISESKPRALMSVQIKPFAKLTFQEKTHSPPSRPLPKGPCRSTCAEQLEV